VWAVGSNGQISRNLAIAKTRSAAEIANRKGDHVAAKDGPPSRDFARRGPPNALPGRWSRPDRKRGNAGHGDIEPPLEVCGYSAAVEKGRRAAKGVLEVGLSVSSRVNA